MGDKWKSIQELFKVEEMPIGIPDFLINSVIIIILSYLLSLTYRKCASSLSNRTQFAANFFIIGFTTMLIIGIVRSSLALSLGLVGALSIVRFRSAIKEPEELAYLFLTISIGLGLGANQRLLVLIAFAVITSMLWIRYMLGKQYKKQNLFLTISSKTPSQIQLTDIVKVVNQYFDASKLRRFDQNSTQIEVSFLIETSDILRLENCKTALQTLSNDVQISFIEN